MDNTYNVNVCTDCLMVNEYGDQAEGVPANHANVMEAGMEGGRLDVDTTHYDEFSSWPCEICGSVLGGLRYPALLTIKNEAS